MQRRNIVSSSASIHSAPDGDDEFISPTGPSISVTTTPETSSLNSFLITRGGGHPHNALYSSSHWAKSVDYIPTFNGDSIPEHEPTGRRVYYRIYISGSLRDVHRPVSGGDSTLGETLAHYIPPPRKAASVRRHIAKMEGFERYDTLLFHSVSSMEPFAEETVLSLSADSDIGNEHEPLALVVKSPGSRRSSVSTLMTPYGASYRPDVRADHCVPRYIYYRIYDRDVVLLPSVPVTDSQDFTIARTYAHLISPPHSPETLAQHIFMLESKPSHTRFQLFSGPEGCTLMERGTYLNLTDPEGPGSSTLEPIAIVMGADEEPSVIVDLADSTVDAGAVGWFSPSLPSSAANGDSSLRYPTSVSSEGSSQSLSPTPPSPLEVGGMPRGWIIVQMNRDQTSNGSDGCHTAKKGEILYMNPIKQSGDSTSLWRRHAAVFPEEREIKFILRPGSTSQWMGHKDTVTRLVALPNVRRSPSRSQSTPPVSLARS